MDDDLGDLGDVMGDDYEHGYDDGKGDPNIKPKPAKPPVEDQSKRGETTLGIVFAEQQQFLTKLMVHALPLLNVANREGNPFSMFDSTPGRIAVAVKGDPVTATTCDFSGLMPGMPYVFRLVCTNPAGTTFGKNSKPILTKPAPPQAPVFLHAKASSIFIRFQENSRGGKQVVNKLTIGVAKAGPADPFATANKPGSMSDESSGAGTLKQARIQKLKPGTLYVFRLTVSNAAGSATGPISAPMLTVPGQPARLREDSKKRTSDSVTLKFAKHGQHLTHLTLQYALLSGAQKSTFDQLMKKGGKQEPIPYPQKATEYTVKGLEGNKKYVFRLASKNKSGIAIGTVLGPITTVEHAPEMADKSGWMFEVPEKTKKGRRMSSRKKTEAKKYWYVIDGRLLTWFDDIKGEEIGYLHLSKLKRITYVPNSDGQASQFALLLKTGAKITFECSSNDPNLTTHDYTMSWMSAIQKSLAAVQKSMEEYRAAENANKKQGRRASIQASNDDELEDDDEVIDEDDGFDMEAEGFGEDAEDTFGGDFEGFEDDDDGDDFGDDKEFGAGDDFGGFDDGGGEFDEDLEEGEEAFGEDFGDFEGDEAFGDDDFGGFE